MESEVIVRKRMGYVKPVTKRVELPEDIAADCSYDSVIHSSTGDLTVGWKPKSTTIYIVTTCVESQAGQSHYSFTLDTTKTYRFVTGLTGEWAECGAKNSNYSGNCEYNICSGFNDITKVLEVMNDDGTWSSVTIYNKLSDVH